MAAMRTTLGGLAESHLSRFRHPTIEAVIGPRDRRTSRAASHPSLDDSADTDTP
jgi:hypothetical protein